MRAPPPRGARAGQGGGPGWALPGSRGADGGAAAPQLRPSPPAGWAAGGESERLGTPSASSGFGGSPGPRPPAPDLLTSFI